MSIIMGNPCKRIRSERADGYIRYILEEKRWLGGWRFVMSFTEKEDACRAYSQYCVY